MVDLMVQQPLWHREWKGAEFYCISDWVLGSLILPLLLCLSSGLPQPDFLLFSQGPGCYLLPSLFVSLHLLYCTNRPYSLLVCTSSTPKDKSRLVWSLSLLDTMSALERTLEAVLWMVNHCIRRPIPGWVSMDIFIMVKTTCEDFYNRKLWIWQLSSKWG